MQPRNGKGKSKAPSKVIVASPGKDRPWGAYTLLIILLLAAAGTTWYQAQPRASEAPDFTVTSTGYRDGVQAEPEIIRLSDYRGQVVVLDLMGVTCTSCRIVTDHVLIPINESHPDVAIISVDVWVGRGGETEEDLIRLQKEEDVPWPHALDTDDVLLKYSAAELPKVVVIDREGQVALSVVGVPSLDRVESAVVAAKAGESSDVDVVQLGILGLAFVAGLASVFSPCSIGLLPAYLSFLLGQNKGATTGRALRGGVTTAGGIIATYAVIAVILLFAGEALRPWIPVLNPIVAVLLIVLGIMMFAGFDWGRLTSRLGGAPDGRRGFFAFGIGYGMAAFGCTGPIFVPVLLAAFLRGPVTGLTAFGLYTVAVAGLIVGAALLVAAGRKGILGAFLAKSHLINKISAGLMVAAGGYLLWFSWTGWQPLG